MSAPLRDQPEDSPPPAPGPGAALGLSAGVSLATSLLFAAFAPTMDPLASRALALVLGVGAIGALAAANIPPPHGARLGLRGLDRHAVAACLLLVPVALLTSELDNIARAGFGAGSAFGETPPERSAILWLQILAIVVGIEPVVEEWFFRGVLQQGSVARWGPRAGVLWCALLFSGYAVLGRATSGADAAAIGVQSLALGLCFGGVRLATGSLLAPILLHGAINALAVVGARWFPIAGFTGPGAHTDPLWLLAAAASCAAGFQLLRRPADEAPRPPDPEPPEID